MLVINLLTRKIVLFFDLALEYYQTLIELKNKFHISPCGRFDFKHIEHYTVLPKTLVMKI